MNIVICNPVEVLDSGERVCLFPSRWDATGKRNRFHYYPYELAYLSALLKRELPNANVTMIDANIEGLNVEQCIERVKPFKPDVFITECSAVTYKEMTRVMQALGVKSILTGPYGMYNMSYALDDRWSFVVSGEYEINVLSYLKEEMATAGYIDLDWLPWPEDEDISRINYVEGANLIDGQVQVYPTRGCPLSCSFCVVPMYYGGHGKSHKSHRMRDVNDVCDELEYLAQKYNGRFSGAFFNEETHNANPEWLTLFCETLIKKGLDKYQYDAMCGYWPMTEDLIKIMSRAGYRQIRVGIESFSEDVGKRIKKVVFEDKFMRFAEWCHKYDVKVYGTLQVGAQGSTFEKDMATLKAVKELKKKGLLYNWQHSVSTPQAGTPYHAEVRESGLMFVDDNAISGSRASVSWPDYPAWQINQARKIFQSVQPEAGIC